MSEAAINEQLYFSVFITKSRRGISGLTVTVDVYDESDNKIITAAEATNIPSTGFYCYALPAPYNNMAGVYKALFESSDESVDMVEVPAAVVVRGNNTSPAGTLPIVSGTSLTRSDLIDFITEFAASENSKPNTKLYDTLLSQALKDISEKTKLIKQTWTNALDGALVIVGNTVTLYADILAIDRVEWDNTAYPLVQRSEAELDGDYNGWRDATGDPHSFTIIDTHTLMLSSAPSGDTTGKLTIRGRGYLPEFGGDGTQNPLEFIPRGSQLMVAYYVIANLPVPLVQPINDSSAAFNFAQNEMKRRQEVRAEYMSKYAEQVEIVTASCNRKTKKPFGF